MGDNSYGQLGDGTTDNGNYETNLPEQIVASNVTAISGGEFHSLFLKSDGSLWAMGNDSAGELGDGNYYNPPNPPYGIIFPELIVVNPAYNQISIQLLSGGNVSLSYVGMAGTNYALDFSLSLSPASWIPQVTNTVSGRSKPAREGRMKTSHFEGRIASSAADAALGRDERTQRELT
ncbi:MAG: hypothetical protein WBS33_08775, partial [Verrucomicrobiia bacterium]